MVRMGRVGFGVGVYCRALDGLRMAIRAIGILLPPILKNILRLFFALKQARIKQKWARFDRRSTFLLFSELYRRLLNILYPGS